MFCSTINQIDRLKSINYTDHYDFECLNMGDFLNKIHSVR